MSETPWTWTFHSSSGESVIPDDDGGSFERQTEAEAWMGLNFETLIEVGVDDVRLMHGAAEVYTMSLHPA